MGAGSALEMRRSGSFWLLVFCALGVWSTGQVAGSEMTCVSCPTGQYLEYVSEDEMRCRACPANSRTPSAANATSVLDCECEAAYTSSSRICEECGLGTFKPAFGNVSCTVCPANTNTTALGRAAASDCLCVSGFYLPEIPTKTGFFTDYANFALTVQRGQTVEIGWVGSHPFGVSTEGVKGALLSSSVFGYDAGNADNKVTRFHVPTDFDGVLYFFCVNHGAMGNANSQITILDNNVVCVPCAPGHFKGFIANDVCALCVAGTFCPEQTSVPEQCVANSASAEGSGALSDCQCLPGFYLDESAGYECVQCAVGTYKEEQGQQACSVCPANTFNPELGSISLGACEPCDPAARAPEGSSAVGACLCSLGYSGQPGGDCEACVPGKFRSNTAEYICSDCPVDSYNDQPLMDSVESCISCPANTSSQGQFGSGALLECLCDAGFRAALADDASAWRCTECGAGRFQATPNSSVCDECPRGTFSAALTAISPGTCGDCADGTFADSLASSVCVACSPSNWQNLAESDAKSKPCQRCPGNSSSDVTGAISVTTCVCLDGFSFYSDSFVDELADVGRYGCGECEAGQYCPGAGSSLDCPVNTWSIRSVNAGPCTECAPHSYALRVREMGSPGQCQCVRGAEGSYDQNCSLCGLGTYQPCDFSLGEANPGPECGQAPATDAASAQVCAACPADTYSDHAGAASCSACPANSSSARGSVAVTNCRCNPRFYGEDGASCVSCPVRRFCHSGLDHACRVHSSSPVMSDSADDCTCNAGYYSVNSTSRCLKCVAGYYCIGGEHRALCPANSSSDAGATSRTACACDAGAWRGCINDDQGLGRNHSGLCVVDYAHACTPCRAGDICFNSTLLHCPTHSTSVVGSSDADDCVCNSGYYNKDVETHHETHHD